MELLGLADFQQGDVDKAEQCWKQAVQWDSRNANALVGLGRLALHRNQPAVAVTWLERAAESAPQALEPVYNPACAYRMLGKIVEANRCEQLTRKLREARPITGGMSDLSDARIDLGQHAIDGEGPAR